MRGFVSSDIKLTRQTNRKRLAWEPKWPYATLWCRRRSAPPGAWVARASTSAASRRSWCTRPPCSARASRTPRNTDGNYPKTVTPSWNRRSVFFVSKTLWNIEDSSTNYHLKCETSKAIFFHGPLCASKTTAIIYYVSIYLKMDCKSVWYILQEKSVAWKVKIGENPRPCWNQPYSEPENLANPDRTCDDEKKTWLMLSLLVLWNWPFLKEPVSLDFLRKDVMVHAG